MLNIIIIIIITLNIICISILRIDLAKFSDSYIFVEY